MAIEPAPKVPNPDIHRLITPIPPELELVYAYQTPTFEDHAAELRVGVQEWRETYHRTARVLEVSAILAAGYGLYKFLTNRD